MYKAFFFPLSSSTRLFIPLLLLPLARHEHQGEAVQHTTATDHNTGLTGDTSALGWFHTIRLVSLLSVGAELPGGRAWANTDLL